MEAERQQDGVYTHVMQEYTARGQLRYKTEPFRGGDAIASTVWGHEDVLGRPTWKLAPKGASDGRGDLLTRYAYAGRSTRIEVCGSNEAPGSAGCLQLSRTTDSLGRYVETRDADQGRTRFWYEANGNVTRASYNAIGQRMQVNDPNQGSWSFLYNALGEVIQQTDARGIATYFVYDKLGRPTLRTAQTDATGDGVADLIEDHWTYDPANAIGAPWASTRQLNGQTERWTGTTYDHLSRPVQTDALQAVASDLRHYRQRSKYDSHYGRPLAQEWPNGESVQVLYSAYGHALVERDPVSGVEYRRTNAINARGQALTETYGNGMTLNAQYQWQTGQLTQLRYAGSSGEVRQLGYAYDVFGNVITQSLNSGASQEEYRYDRLHRLVQSMRSGAASGTVRYGYDAVGNLTKKTDFSADSASAYAYTGGTCGGGANAVKAVQLKQGGTRTYCYDANGNLTDDNAGLSLRYDHQNLPIRTTRGTQSNDFRYGPDGMRTRSWGSDGVRVYLPGYEERLDTGETKVYVGDYAVVSRSGATRKVEYLLKDRLGSVDAVANTAGALTETRGYDAFGKPRDGTWNDLTPARIQNTSTTPKGFTQHEHLNALELIHMNGRAYDYHLGRFTGVDPFIQFPLNSQSLNPYSYILNNPLAATDPTGYKANMCRAETGTHIPKCDAFVATSYNAKGDVIEQQKFIANSGALEKTAAAGIGTLSYSNGAEICRGPKGPDPNAYKKAENTGKTSGRAQNESDQTSFWGGVGQRLANGFGKGMFKTDAEMDEWGAGLQAAMSNGNDAVAEYFRQTRPWSGSTAIFESIAAPGALFLKPKNLGVQGIRAANAGATIKGFSSVETGVILEARGILASKEMDTILAAHRAGISYEGVINGRLVLFEPGMPSSGFTLFQEKGFVIGREAFSSRAELQKTVLQELYRLTTTRSAGGLSRAGATQETNAAFEFSERAVNAL
jgi:RHS repeat-associated protein